MTQRWNVGVSVTVADMVQADRLHVVEELEPARHRHQGEVFTMLWWDVN